MHEKQRPACGKGAKATLAAVTLKPTLLGDAPLCADTLGRAAPPFTSRDASAALSAA